MASSNFLTNSTTDAGYARDKSQVQMIGISGTTRSGKTTLQHNLSNFLKSDKSTKVMKLSQDYFFKYHWELIDPSGDINWDEPNAINWDDFYSQIVKMRKDLLKTLGQQNKDGVIISKGVILVEGFMLFYEERLRELFNCRIWLEIDRTTCHKRRMETFPVSEDYFNLKLWPNYVNYRALLFDELRVPLHSIDAALNDHETVANQAVQIIGKYL